MSDAEEEVYEGTSIYRTAEQGTQGEQRRTHHDSGRKLSKQRRKRAEEEEEEEDEGDEEGDEDDDEEDGDDDGDDDEEGVARGSKRLKVSCPTVLDCQPSILRFLPAPPQTRRCQPLP
jgi:hypothetical protein